MHMRTGINRYAVMGDRAAVSRRILASALLAMGVPASSVSAFAEEVSAADRAAFLAVLAGVESGWEEGSGVPFRRHYTADPQALFVESGGADVGVEHLVEHHVVPEGAALADLQLDFEPLQMGVDGDLGWILARSEFRAVVRSDGRAIHSQGYETLVLERSEDGWKVVHAHGSSRDLD